MVNELKQIMKEFLPCPFCGKIPEISVIPLGMNRNDYFADCICKNCNYVYFEAEGKTDKEALENLRNQWNTRYEGDKR